MTIFDFTRNVVAVIGALGLLGGAAVGLAYWLFKAFAAGWLKAQFDKDLAAFTASKDQELERLRAEIGRLANRASLFHAKEYEVLPEAWGLLNKAHGAAGQAVAGMKILPPLDSMSSAELLEFLENTNFRETEKMKIRTSGAKMQEYSNILDWKNIGNAEQAQAEFQNCVILHGVFIEDTITEKMTEAARILRSTLIAQRLAKQGSRELYQTAMADFTKLDPLVQEIRSDVRRRLWAIQIPEQSQPPLGAHQVADGEVVGAAVEAAT